MASTLKHLRSSTADKRPTASGLVDGQFAINTASGTPAVFFKDNNGGVVKVGPAHVGPAAPNAVPAGSAGNSLGELWVDNSLTTPGLNYYTGSAFVNLTPSGTTTTVGLVELATPAETQTGTDAVRAVTPSGLQSKVSDSTSTTSSTTIASSTAVKSAYDLANAALPKAGGTITGELLIGNTGSLVFEGSSDDSFETTIAVVDPTGDRTITFPNVTGTVVTTGDSGTVTSTMIANDTIVNADINSAAAIAYSKLALSSGIVNTDISASAAIVDTKLATISTADKVSISALNIDGATDIGGALENGDLFIVDDGAGGTNRKAPAFRMSQLVYSGVTGDITIASGGTSAIGAGVIVNADVNASAAIAGTKISPDFGSQNTTTTGTSTAASFIPTSSTVPTNGVYLPAANSVAISTNGTGKLFVDASGRVGVGTATPGNPIHLSAASNAFISITNTTASATNFIGTNSGGDLDLNANGSQILLFKTAGQERLRITSAGLVGVGTSSPSCTLQVNGSSTVSSQVNVAAQIGANVTSDVLIGSINGNTPFIASQGAYSLQLRTNNASALTIDSSQRVGIGTTSPGTTLDVAGNQRFSAANPALEFNNGGPQIFLPGANTLAFATGGGIGSPTERARIDSSGRVGIGTSAVTNLLHLRSDSASAVDHLYLQNRNGGASSGARIAFSNGIVDYTDNRYAYIGALNTGATENGNVLVFATNANGQAPVERMRLTATGLGIGTTSPGRPLEVNGIIRTTATGTTSDAAQAFEINNSNAGVDPRVLVLSGTNNGSAIIRNASTTAGGIQFQIQGGEVARIDSSGRLLVGTSSIVLGSPKTIVEKTSSDIDLFRVQCGATEIAGNIAGLSFGHGINGARPKTAIGAVATGSFGLSNLVFYVDSTGDNNSVSSSDEKMRIDTSGRLLVGTSSARTNFYNGTNTAQIQLEGTNYQNAAFAIVCNANSDDKGSLILAKNRGTTVGSNTIVQDGDDLGSIEFQGSDGAEFVQAAAIKAEVDGTPGTNDMPGRLVFSTTADGASSPTERMRIDNGGNVLTGQQATSTPGRGNTTTGCSIRPVGTAYFSVSNELALSLNRNTADGAVTSFFREGVNVGSISVTTTATAYNTSSDYRLKENVTAVTDGISRLQQLKPSRFNFIADPGTTVDGFIAHEVQAVVPEAITGEKDAVDDEGNPIYQGIDQSKLVPLLTAALQEAISEIESLKARVAALETP